MSGWRGWCLDMLLYALGLALTWGFPVLVRILAVIDYQAVTPERYPDGH